MAVVKISKRRIYIPREYPLDADEAIIIPFGAGYLVYPIPRKFVKVDIDLTVEDAKKVAERKAKQDALSRLRRKIKSAN